MEIRQLQYFVAIAEELSFTRAAARCHVVQSALSYQIGRLEREHRSLLFERSSRSVRLAPAGSLLLPRARRILAELDLASSELAALAGVLSGRLRLGMVGSANQAAPIVESTLAVFHQRHPAVEITIQDSGSRQMADLVRSGGLDVAFVGLFGDQLPGDLAYQLLAVESLVAAVPRDHRLAGRGRVELAELAADGAPFVEMRDESGLRRQVDAAFERAGIHRTIAFELGSSDEVVRFVGMGFGTALVPVSAVVSRPDLAILPLVDRGAQHPVTVIHRRPRPAAPSAQAFLELLGDALAAS